MTYGERLGQVIDLHCFIRAIPVSPCYDMTMAEKPKEDLDKLLNGGVAPAALRFALNVIGGLIPFAGGAVSGISSAWSEQEQQKINALIQAWLKLQEDEIKEIGQTMFEILARLDLNDENVAKRMESPEYLSLVKKAFRDWSAAESEEKRKLIRNLLTNAAGTNITSDDVIAMFLTWIDRYSEMHFKVIGAIYNSGGISRFDVWQKVDGRQVADNSPEADLFKFIFHELTTGYVIRQHREVNYAGQYVKPRAVKRTAGMRNGVYTSPFEDGKQYELTGLGQQFVHYTMNEIVPRIEAKTDDHSPANDDPNAP